MTNVTNIGDMMALACDCGSVHYNLLKSNRIECAGCGHQFGNWRKYEAQPLSDEEIEIAFNNLPEKANGTNFIIRFARAIEKAIMEKNK